MRRLTAILLALPLFAVAQDAARYGVALDAKTYPQSTAKEAFTSALQAIDQKKFAYLVAHLADPTFVDARVKANGGDFAEQVRDTQTRLDPATVKLLQRLAKDGTWTVGKMSAVLGGDNPRERVVRMTLKDGRWYLQHDSTPEK